MMVEKKTVSIIGDCRTAIKYWQVARSNYKINIRGMCNTVFNITIKTGFGNICFRNFFDGNRGILMISGKFMQKNFRRYTEHKGTQ